MGWLWEDDDEFNSSDSGEIAEYRNPSYRIRSGDRCSTRKVVQRKCHTEEVEPGKFLKKCEKTEQTLRDCLGKPTEIVQSNKEYTEEDVTDEVMKGSSTVGSSGVGPFDFPGLRSDIEAIERGIFGGINRFFEAADEMKNEFFSMLNDESLFGEDSSSSAKGRVKPFKGDIQEKTDMKTNNSADSGGLDIPSLARDV